MLTAQKQKATEAISELESSARGGPGGPGERRVSGADSLATARPPAALCFVLRLDLIKECRP